MTKIVISEKLKQYRKEHNITQAEFGELINVSPQAISKWERCECYPDIILLPKLAEIFGCSVSDFFE